MSHDDPRRICPECGEAAVDWVEVDIGVGIQCGPRECSYCHWSEYPETADDSIFKIEDW